MEEIQVILVDENDRQTGQAGKMDAHMNGMLHRAFSVFIFNNNGKMLLQQRALNKYHSGGLWSNACCSHPEPGEETATAAVRRLKEEMGIETHLYKLFDFVYKAEFNNGLTEYEFDHVFAGEYDGVISLAAEEAAAFCFEDMEKIESLLQQNPQEYTAWFHLAFPQVKKWWDKQYGEKRA
jgi:isopentenyl-diphosphate delta-isomerase